MRRRLDAEITSGTQIKTELCLDDVKFSRRLAERELD